MKTLIALLFPMVLFSQTFDGKVEFKPIIKVKDTVINSGIFMHYYNQNLKKWVAESVKDSTRIFRTYINIMIEGKIEEIIIQEERHYLNNKTQ